MDCIIIGWFLWKRSGSRILIVELKFVDNFVSEVRLSEGDVTIVVVVDRPFKEFCRLSYIFIFLTKYLVSIFVYNELIVAVSGVVTRNSSIVIEIRMKS